MTESARIACCITGCRRTFRAEDVGDSSRYMCGKHFRCDHDLLTRIKRLKRRFARMERIVLRRYARGVTEDQLQRMEIILDNMAARHDEVFEQIAREAQRQQDAGLFAPKPRRRKVPLGTSRYLSDPHSGRFDAAFQRLKRAQAREAC